MQDIHDLRMYVLCVDLQVIINFAIYIALSIWQKMGSYK